MISINPNCQLALTTANADPITKIWGSLEYPSPRTYTLPFHSQRSHPLLSTCRKLVRSHCTSHFAIHRATRTSGKLTPTCSVSVLGLSGTANQWTYKMTYYGDHAPRVTTTVITLMTIAYVVFGLRLYTRLQNKAWGMDDWCMTTAVVSNFLRVSL